MKKYEQEFEDLFKEKWKDFADQFVSPEAKEEVKYLAHEMWIRRKQEDAMYYI